jgi:CheY-like chemotaxis protein
MEDTDRAGTLPSTPHIPGTDDEQVRTSRISVLYIEQTPVLLDIACKYLERDGGDIMVDTSMSAEHALQKMRYIRYDLVVTDYNNPDIAGNTLLRYIRSQGNPIPIIYFVLFRVPDLESEAAACGGVSVVDKLDFGGHSSFRNLALAIREAHRTFRHGPQQVQGCAPEPAQEVKSL